MTGPVQRADPAARGRAIATVCAAAALGLAAVRVLEHVCKDIPAWIEGHLDRLIEQPLIVFIEVLVLLSPVLVAGLYLLVLGRRIARARRFPPPGRAVVRDTPVLEGHAAVRRGRIVQLLAACLLCAAGAVPILVWHVFRSLVQPP